MGLFLGIDTSCYTTSLAVMDDRGILLAEQRQILRVKQGTCGLRQSEAVWQHLHNLPLLLEQLLTELPLERLQRELQAITVSERPRPLEVSYMPVFEAGLNFAKTLAAAWSVPLLCTSHQEGHILAALWSAEQTGKNPSAEKQMSEMQFSMEKQLSIEKQSSMEKQPGNFSLSDLNRFLAVHLSGGTTELLLVEKATVTVDQQEKQAKQQSLSGQEATGRAITESETIQPSRQTAQTATNRLLLYNITKLGGSIDIPAGQLIDRVGVKLGLAFPAGAALEQLARQAAAAENSFDTAPTLQQQAISSVVHGYEINFSGAENQADRLLAQGMASALVARQVEACVAKALEKVLRRAVAEYQIKDVLLAGGVAANRYLRARLCRQLEHRAVGARLIFAKPYYSTDNAAGTALAGAISEAF